jgi:hypothetical protein
MTKRLLLVVTVALVAVCGTPTAPCACEPQRTHLVVYGAVRTAAGTPVAGAKVFAAVAPAGTPAYDPVVVAGDGVTTTDADGNYRVRVVSLFSPTAPAAVRAAVVRAPADTIRTEALGASLRRVDQTADSLALNIVVP